MNCNKECKYFSSIANTDETKMGICRFTEGYESVQLDKLCPFTPRDWEPTCADCDRLGNDFGCMTCRAEDSAMHNGHICCGFIDIAEADFMKALTRLKLQNRYSQATVGEWIEKFEREFKTPQD